jgi:hypothetical protein
MLIFLHYLSKNLSRKQSGEGEGEGEGMTIYIIYLILSYPHKVNWKKFNFKIFNGNSIHLVMVIIFTPHPHAKGGIRF